MTDIRIGTKQTSRHDVKTFAELAAHCDIKTHAALFELYEVSSKTFKKWLIDAGLNIPSTYITPANLALILEKLGIPKKVIEKYNIVALKSPEISRNHIRD